MNPQDKALLLDINRRLIALERATNPAFTENLKRVLGSITVTIEDGASTTGTTQAVRNAADTGSETVADQYAGIATVKVNGTTLGRIGYY
jgi:hypothetical protein